MDANRILSADLLDILFEGRNKAYGAYDLRKTYAGRLGKSLLIMFGVLLLLVGAHFLSGYITPDKPVLEVKGDIELTKVDETPKEKKIEVLPPKTVTPPKAPEKINMVKLTNPPLIEKDPPKEAIPPEMDKTETAKIGNANITDGKDDVGIVGPEANDKNGKDLLSVPKNTDEGYNKFIPIEKESEYPGGPEAWRRFLERNLFNNLPQDAVDNGIQGTIVLRFVVDVDGAISDISYVSGPKEYYDVAVKSIRKSGKWEPALQNGHKVKTYKVQAITIRLQE